MSETTTWPPVKGIAHTFGTATCMAGAGVGNRCPNVPTRQSPASGCAWCDEHAYESDVPLTPESEAAP